MLVCYDFHFGISNEEKDLMFAIGLILFSIETKFVSTPISLEHHVSLIHQQV
jgi:hypothetical protein